MPLLPLDLHLRRCCRESSHRRVLTVCHSSPPSLPSRVAVNLLSLALVLDASAVTLYSSPPAEVSTTDSRHFLQSSLDLSFPHDPATSELDTTVVAIGPTAVRNRKSPLLFNQATPSPSSRGNWCCVACPVGRPPQPFTSTPAFHIRLSLTNCRHNHLPTALNRRRLIFGAL
ncbi:hypothetical protein AAHA92_32932 [Salvia divinorum]|uniref:Uncharacterized protein n=1 Tax=Salvia divinorum TaxID=28513 RepID=A0ABD1FMB5_SALDI